jgi:site-specific DNA recombinase
LLAIRKIEADDYREMKSDYGSMITKLEVKLGSLNNEEDDIDELLREV